MKSKTLKTCLMLGGLLLSAATSFAQSATNTPPPVHTGPTNTPWDVTASVGVTITRGNSDTTLIVGKALGIKKWNDTKEELDLGADAAYGENSGVKNTAQAHAFGQFNYSLTERLYAYFRVEGLHDDIAGINYRISVSPGLGYYFIKRPNIFLRGEVGPGYVYEVDNTPTNNTHSYATLRLAERLEQKINDRSKWWEGVEYLPQVDKFDNYILNGEIGIDSSLTKKTSMQAYIQDSYHNEPTPGHLKNDFKLVFAWAYKF